MCLNMWNLIDMAFIASDILRAIFNLFHFSSASLMLLCDCAVSNNDTFSSFTESMPKAHEHHWIYGGSQGMLIRQRKNAKMFSAGRESCLVITTSQSSLLVTPLFVPQQPSTLLLAI